MRNGKGPDKEYNLSQAAWSQLFRAGTTRNYAAREIIYFQDEPNVGLVCLKDGRMKNCLFMADGTEKTICILEAPSISGETGVIDGGVSTCSAVAVTEVTVVTIPREDSIQILLSSPEIMMVTVQMFAKKMRSTLMQVEGMTTSIPQRLALMLLAFHKFGVYTHQENDDCLVITHDELGHFLGTSRPKITEILSEFVRLGLIERGRGYIVLKNVKGLEAVRSSGFKGL